MDVELIGKLDVPSDEVLIAADDDFGTLGEVKVTLDRAGLGRLGKDGVGNVARKGAATLGRDEGKLDVVGAADFGNWGPISALCIPPSNNRRLGSLVVFVWPKADDPANTSVAIATTPSENIL